eukprot:3710990-Rhodomonas_salina.3
MQRCHASFVPTRSNRQYRRPGRHVPGYYGAYHLGSCLHAGLTPHNRERPKQTLKNHPHYASLPPGLTLRIQRLELLRAILVDCPSGSEREIHHHSA